MQNGKKITFFYFFLISNDLFLYYSQANENQQQDLATAISNMANAAMAIQTKRRTVLREQEILKTAFVAAEMEAKRVFQSSARTQGEADSFANHVQNAKAVAFGNLLRRAGAGGGRNEARDNNRQRQSRGPRQN